MRRALPVLVALIALALSACGEDSLSDQQLRAQATAICTRASRATDRIALPISPDHSAPFLTAGLAQLRPAAAKLSALKPPRDLRTQYDRAVQLAAQEIALISLHARAIANGDDPADTFRQLAAALRPLTTEENAYWRALEIPSCVRT